MPPVLIEDKHKKDLLMIALDAVEEVTKVEKKELLGRRRIHGIVVPRFMVYKLIREECGHVTLSWVGDKMGGRDHGSIIHGVSSLNNLLATDKTVQREYVRVLEMFEANRAQLLSKIDALRTDENRMAMKSVYTKLVDSLLAEKGRLFAQMREIDKQLKELAKP